MEHTVQYGRTSINYALRRANRKTMAIEVHPDLTVRVIAPANASIEDIDAKVIKRGLWIARQKRYFESFLPRTPKREYVSGETHLYLGRRYMLKVVKGERNEVKLKGGQLFVFIDKCNVNTTAHDVLAGWYKSRGEKILEKHLQKNLEAFKPYNIEEPPLVIQRMKKRWGSLTSTKKLILNPELIKTPVKCIDYVIIHELCHLIHPNHGKAFNQLQDIMMHDNQRWKQRLEQILV
ncbi:MAG: M48 family metallopeptidase [Bacteroidales bacterium]|nr:M48 family metallopeptidase [Bacteroidales bacterium]